MTGGRKAMQQWFRIIVNIIEMNARDEHSSRARGNLLGDCGYPTTSWALIIAAGFRSLEDVPAR